MRGEIAARLDAIGHPEWSARFSESFTVNDIDATLAEVYLLLSETWADYLAEWDSLWEAAQNDVWAGLLTAGLTETLVQGIRADADARAKHVFKAMPYLASMLLMKHRHHGAH